MKIKIEGYNTITGTPEAILQVMQDARFIPERNYIEATREILQRCFDTELHVEGTTDAERAESFLREMARAQMIEIEEEN